MKMSETRPRSTMLPVKSGPLTVFSVSRTVSLVTDMARLPCLCCASDSADFAGNTKPRYARVQAAPRIEKLAKRVGTKGARPSLAESVRCLRKARPTTVIARCQRRCKHAWKHQRGCEHRRQGPQPPGPSTRRRSGLTPVHDEGEDVVVTKSGDTLINVYRSQFAGTNKATAVTWTVGDEIGRDRQAAQATRTSPSSTTICPTRRSTATSMSARDEGRLVQGSGRQHPEPDRRGSCP